MSQITFKLSKTAIQKAIRMAKKDEEKLQEYCDEVSKMMAQEAVKKAREVVCQKAKYPTAAFLESISYTFSYPGSWKFRLAGKYAKQGRYAEFGTGPVGAKHPHPKARMGMYATHGWVTRAGGKDMKNLYGWKPFTAMDGSTVYYTSGQRPMAFMYEARQHIKRQWLINRVAAAARRKVFGR